MAMQPYIGLKQIKDLFREPYEKLPDVAWKKVEDTDLTVCKVEKNPRKVMFRIKRSLELNEVNDIAKTHGYVEINRKENMKWVLLGKGNSFLQVFVAYGKTNFDAFDPMAAILAYQIVQGIK